MNNVEPKTEKPKTEQELAQEFLKKYYALCAVFLITLFFVFKSILIPIHFNGT